MNTGILQKSYSHVVNWSLTDGQAVVYDFWYIVSMLAVKIIRPRILPCGTPNFIQYLMVVYF